MCQSLVHLRRCMLGNGNKIGSFLLQSNIFEIKSRILWMSLCLCEADATAKPTASPAHFRHLVSVAQWSRVRWPVFVCSEQFMRQILFAETIKSTPDRSHFNKRERENTCSRDWTRAATRRIFTSRQQFLAFGHRCVLCGTHVLAARHSPHSVPSETRVRSKTKGNQFHHWALHRWVHPSNTQIALKHTNRSLSFSVGAFFGATFLQFIN